MATTAWVEKRLDARQQAARARVIRRQRGTNAKKMAWTRDIARVVLVASVLTLGILAVEIGRKAVTVLNHASAVATVSIG